MAAKENIISQEFVKNKTPINPHAINDLPKYIDISRKIIHFKFPRLLPSL